MTRLVKGLDDHEVMNTTLLTAAAPVAQSSLEITRLLRRAMANPDELVVEMEYSDSKGAVTRRTISPIRFVGSERVLALCLCREEPRQFYLNRCSGLRLLSADSVLMPVAMRA